MQIPVKPGRDVALLIEAAAQTYKLKSLDFDVAKRFNDQLIDSMIQAAEDNNKIVK